MEGLELVMSFWKGKRVLVTGHTGFKGSWLSDILLGAGATVFGLSLEPKTRPALFDQLSLSSRMDHSVGDIRDPTAVLNVVQRAAPDIVFHLAAQPLVRSSYQHPVETWSTNVMGTVHLLDAISKLKALCSVVVVTTDKVYENREWEHSYRETDQLGGNDPYSASKASTELVVESWRSSFLSATPIRVATARAGNVIGGGDWSKDRIMPDLARAFGVGQPLIIRNVHAIRPWQHVLDPLRGYIVLAEALFGSDGPEFEMGFNFGPEPSDQRTVGELVNMASNYWVGDWHESADLNAPNEAGRLSLSIDRSRQLLRWTPRWNFAESVVATVAWYRDAAAGANPATLVRQQIDDFGFWR